MSPTYTAWAYDTDTGRTRRTMRRFASLHGAMQGIAMHVGLDAPASSDISTPDHRGQQRDTFTAMSGEWQLCVRRHA